MDGIALVVVVAVAVSTLGRERQLEAAPTAPSIASHATPEAGDSSLPPAAADDAVEPAGDPTRLPVSIAPGTPSAGRAVAVVRVVFAGASTPLANVGIGFFRGDVTLTAPVFTEEWYEEISRSDAEFFKEYRTLSDSCVTGASGIVELSVPAGKGFTIQASSDDPSLEGTRLDVPALAADERREVTLETARGGRVFLGRVAEREGEAPVRSAVVTLVDKEDEELARTESDASGGFSFRVASFDHDRIVRIEAPGFAVAFGDLAERHEQPGGEAIFRLNRAAVLFGRVTLADGTASPGSLVLALAKRAHLKQPAGVAMPTLGDDKDLRQGAITDDAGSYRLEGLPASVRLQVGAFVEDESFTSDLLAITLAPGEERELPMVLDPAPILDVLVVDERGAPVPGLELWLAQESWASSGRATPRYFNPDEDPETKVTSDGAGRCRIDSIAKGAWFLGPAPAASQTGFGAYFFPDARNAAAGKRTYPAVGQPILVRAGEQEIMLVLERGESIEGRVVDPEGPLKRAAICSDTPTGARSRCDRAATGARRGS